MLSPLQRRLRQIIDTIPEAADVALAGGGALIVRGVVARATADLDYFATSLRDVDRLLPALEARLEQEGLRTGRVQDHPGFARLSVSDGQDTARIDLAWDVRLWPPDMIEGSVLLSERELGADKLLALADRGEARDYIDVAALADRVGFARLYELAQRKHPKLHPGQLLRSLAVFEALPRGDFDLSDREWQQLRTQINSWRNELEHLSARDSRPDPTRFPELGW
ncbi:MAG: nucleotidyl transferase AbiEii/AbiGii toxin family protein [bacterium]|nr:nucleotidyl transferase AbiEii/AbiGii toxin family protein [bacterium]MDE0353983.1 nucleotidyl transferase AbiEii/AbiGii toxin family protein [bacterium]